MRRRIKIKVRCRLRVKGMAYKVSGKDSGRRVWWRRCGTTEIDMVVEDMWDGNR